MFPFDVVEHTVQCGHIREYPRALLNSQEDILHLAVKQYIPKNNLNPQPGDITIIGAHANGFPKELYEPLWEDLLARSQKQNFRIRSIWVADAAHQGQSGVLNEELIGNDPGWNDNARDLLHLINTKRDQMPRPIIGIGHSMGGSNLVNVAYMHPRLFTTLVLIDPVIQITASTPKEAGPNPAQLSTFRRDLWPSREAAAKSFSGSKFYQKWDPRVLDRWVRYGLRDLPTAIYPLDPNGTSSGSGGPEQVTLTTTRHQEVFTFLRPNYDGVGYKGNPLNRKTHPDLDPRQDMYPFYRAEGPLTFDRLPYLRPSVLYIFGGASDISPKAGRESKLAKTGVGIGGSGGVAQGRVKGIIFEHIGHLIAMEVVDRTADEASAWIGNEMQIWRDGEEDFNRNWKDRPRLERQTVDEKWKEMVGGPPRPNGSGKSKSKL